MAPDDQPSRRRLALLVATANYSDPGLAALRAPTGDVAALAGVLRDRASRTSTLVGYTGNGRGFDAEFPLSGAGDLSMDKSSPLRLGR